MAEVKLKLICPLTVDELRGTFMEADYVEVCGENLFIQADESIIDFMVDIAWCEGIAE